MKKFLFVFVLFFSVSVSSCQEKGTKDTKEDTKEKAEASNVPEAVELGFKSKYPNENDPDWETDANRNWESHFKKKGEKYRADFALDGTWIETENTIKKENLPKPIKDVIKKEYSDYEISEVEHVLSAEKGEFYDVEFKQKGKNKDVEFREDGTVLNNFL